MRRSPLWLIGVAGALVALAAPAHGQTAGPPSTDYAAAVRTYVETGDAAEAVRRLSATSAGHFETAVEKYFESSEPMLTAAAVFHLEIAFGLVTVAPPEAARHLELGHRIIRRLRETVRKVSRVSSEEASAFAERWYVAAASTLLMVNDPSRAGPFIGRGLEVAPKSLDLRLMAGILDELTALSIYPEDVAFFSQQTRLANARLQAFSRAKDRFAKLLVEAPTFTRARIRLGRVLFLLGETDAALVELLRAQSETRDPVQRFLAAMFLGALYEQGGNVTGARVAYEAALAAAPASQAATVALGYLGVMAGRPDRAQALARALLAEDPVADEWWSYKNGGFEKAALVWLRSKVWR